MRILVAEDDLFLRRMLQTMLVKWGYDVVVTCDGSEAWEALQDEDAPKLALLDWMMPAMDGVEVCRRVRQQTGAPYVYILLLTAKSRKEDIVEAIEAGADDYVTKPFDAHELEVRLRAGRRILDLQEELLSKQEALRIQATHDALTGLWNRTAILDVLQRELDRARRQRTSVGVVMADLDHFKQINDTYDHIVGDDVLREAARRMRISVRSYDSIGRYGGEEFLMVLPECDSATTLNVAERIRESISRDAVNTSGGIISITISLGATVCHEGQGTDVSALVRAADAALYRAKQGGRNRVELATREDGAEHGAR